MLSFVCSITFCLIVQAQQEEYLPLQPQTDTFNSSATIPPSQQSRAGINATLATNVAVALNFERSNFAHGPPSTDAFYTLPPKNTSSSSPPPGTLLKLEPTTNTTAYTLPPNTALSRMIYQSTTTLNNTTARVPVSASILWPYLPRRQPPDGDTYPIVAWAHGTSGFAANCAPSAYRNLLYQYATVYALVLQGYVVVAPDYAGLGVRRRSSSADEDGGEGEEIPHPYLNPESHANDLFYAVEAARSAFPSLLSKEFVVVGHSQGGGAAWGAAVRQAEAPVEGYLGAVVGSPVTDITALARGATGGSLAVYLARTLERVYPSSFTASSILTPSGLGRLRLMQEIEGCFSVSSILLSDPGIARPGWENNTYIRAWNQLSNPAGKAIAGPILVIQGEKDAAVPLDSTVQAVRETCERFPGARLRYAVFEGATHVPVMYAAQRVWLDWIAERFAGREVDERASCGIQETYTPARPLEAYQAETNYFLEFATQGYQVA